MADTLKYVFLAGVGFVAGVYVSSYILGIDQREIYSGIKSVIIDGPKVTPQATNDTL